MPPNERIALLGATWMDDLSLLQGDDADYRQRSAARGVEPGRRVPIQSAFAKPPCRRQDGGPPGSSVLSAQGQDAGFCPLTVYPPHPPSNFIADFGRSPGSVMF